MPTEKPKLSPETIEKLEWLKSRLRKYPHRYDQAKSCGTQACLYGFCVPAMIASRRITLTDQQDLDAAISFPQWADWLGVSRSSIHLLFAGRWGDKAAKFNRLPTDTDKEAAEKACQRIDLFIQSGGTK